MLTYKEIKQTTFLEFKANINNNKSYDKYYIHLDHPLSPKEQLTLLSQIQEPTFVNSFRHLPYLTFKITFNRLHREADNKLSKVKKVRKITMSSHRDAFLLKFYSNVLSASYETYLTDKDFNADIIAYREHKSNITGAKEAFDFIWRDDCWIIKGDFSDFFDNLNHKVLIKNTKKILGTDMTSDIDWFKLLKFVMEYHTISKKQVEKLSWYQANLNSRAYLKKIADLPDLLKTKVLTMSNTNLKGIPQGTAISSPLANIYLIEFDNYVHQLIATYHGFYRRYCDDFVIVIPVKHCSESELLTLKEKVMAYSSKQLHLKIKNEKTKIFKFTKKDFLITELSSPQKPAIFNYIGFSFNGKKIYLRPGTIFRFNYRGKRSIGYLTQYELKIKIATTLPHRDFVKSKNNFLKKIRNKQKRKQHEQDIFNLRSDFFKHRVNLIKNNALLVKHNVVQLCLSNKPVSRKNMLAYATLAEKTMLKPIPDLVSDDHYAVYIKKSVNKRITRLQKKYHLQRKDKTSFLILNKFSKN